MNPLISDTEPRSEVTSFAGDSISDFIEACGYTKKVNQAKILAVWPAAVEQRLGPEARKACGSAKLRDDQLILQVSSSAWRHRMALDVNVLVETINESIG